MARSCFLRLCGGALVLTALLAAPCHAGLATALEKFTVKYTGVDDAFAFSIIVKGIMQEQIMGNPKSDKFGFERFVKEAEGLRITFRDDNKAMKPNDSITVTIEFQKNVDPTKFPIHVERTKSGFYESVGGGPLKLNVAIPGLNAKGDPIYNALNDSDTLGLDLRDLQAMVNVPRIDPDTLDPLSTMTFGTPLGDALLPAGTEVSSHDIDVGHVDRGNWFYVRGQIYEDGEPVGGFIHGFGVAVPEPSSAVVMLAGLVMVVAARLAPRRPPK